MDKRISILICSVLLIFLLSSCSAVSSEEITNLRGKIESLESEINVLKESLAKAEKHLAEKDTEIADINKLNKSLEEKIDSLKYSEKNQYSDAIELKEMKKYNEAIEAFKMIINNFPLSEEAKNSDLQIEEINKTIEDIKKQEEAKRKAYQESIKPPLELVKAWVGFNSIDNPEVYVVVKNTSSKTVDAFTVGIYCYNRYDEPVNHYLYDTNRFGGLSQETIKPGQTIGNNSYWTLHGFENTSKIKVILEKAHMTDGSVWEPVEEQEISINGVSKK